jgi:hypothetical protein
VVCLSTVTASRRFKDELVTRGFSEKFGCYHGGVRILWPGIQREDNPYDHPLLLPVRLEAYPAPVRAERVAGLFCEMIAEDEDLRAWLRELDASPRPEPLRRQALQMNPRGTLAIVHRHPAPVVSPPAHAEPPTSAAPASTGEASRAEAAAAESSGPRPQRPEANPTSTVVPDSTASPPLAPARAVGANEHALALAEASFPERLLVLASARASAKESSFRSPFMVFHVLVLLAFFGRHDGGLESAVDKVMGAQARWRPKDSPETTARFGRERTWVGSDGARKLFRRHITLGHGVDDQRCAQVYYDVANDGRIELAWIGGHRPTVSEDT